MHNAMYCAENSQKGNAGGVIQVTVHHSLCIFFISEKHNTNTTMYRGILHCLQESIAHKRPHFWDRETGCYTVTKQQLIGPFW
jgi:hypothetical protein